MFLKKWPREWQQIYNISIFLIEMLLFFSFATETNRNAKIIFVVHYRMLITELWWLTLLRTVKNVKRVNCSPVRSLVFHSSPVGGRMHPLCWCTVNYCYFLPIRLGSVGEGSFQSNALQYAYYVTYCLKKHLILSLSNFYESNALHCFCITF